MCLGTGTQNPSLPESFFCNSLGNSDIESPVILVHNDKNTIQIPTTRIKRSGEGATATMEVSNICQKAFNSSFHKELKASGAHPYRV